MSSAKKRYARHFVIVLISLAGAAYCAYRLQRANLSAHPYGSNAIEAGVLESKQDSVRRKGEAVLLWDDLQNQQKIYWDDAISTGPKSTAQLRLEKDVQVTLMPSSLAVLSKEDGHISIHLKKGHLKVQQPKISAQVDSTQAAEPPQIIQVNGKKLDISNVVAIDVDQSKGRLKVTKIKSNGQEQATVFSNAVVKAPPPLSIAAIIIESTSLKKSPLKILRKPAQEAPAPLKPKPIIAEIPKAPEPVIHRTPLVGKFWAWVGLGEAFSSYSQQASGISDFHLGGISGMSNDAELGFFASDHIGFDFKYQQLPVQANSGAGINITNSNENLQTLSASMLYRPAGPEENRNAEWLWRLGLEQMDMPFLLPSGASQLTAQTRSVTLLLGGVERRWFASEKLRVRTNLDYNYALSSTAPAGTSFSITPKLSLDANLGADYEFHPNYFIGVNWSLQYQDHTFNYGDTQGGNFSGEQSFIYSILAIRLGAEL